MSMSEFEAKVPRARTDSRGKFCRVRGPNVAVSPVRARVHGCSAGPHDSQVAGQQPQANADFVIDNNG